MCINYNQDVFKYYYVLSEWESFEFIIVSSSLYFEWISSFHKDT